LAGKFVYELVITRPLILLSLIGALAAARADAGFQTGEGSLHISSASLTLHDAARKKDLPVIAYFPKEKGVYPVIVFSHGALGSGKSYVNLLSFWASRGYVCLAPTHDDSLSLHPQQIHEQGGLQVAREEFTQIFHDPPG